jgi:hypothetical protein
MAKASISDLPEIDQFYHAFGKALAAWVDVEFELGELFGWTANLTIGAAREIFASQTSFRGRSGMLGAALRTSKLPRDRRAVIELGLAIAIKWETFRNQLAHNQAQPDDVNGEGSGWRLARIDKWHDITAPDLAALKNAAANFDALRDILRGAMSGQPPELLQRLEALPNQAGSNRLSQNQEGRIRQRGAARPRTSRNQAG